MNPFISKYKTIAEQLDICGSAVNIARVGNLDELFQRLLDKGENDEDVKDERIPYWADLWASAIAMSQHIVKTKIIKRGMHVLEIGCGLGLPGIVAGMEEAKVTFSDYLNEPLEFAKYNWSLNNNFHADFIKMDWRHPDKSLAADVLLASDVAYESKAFPFLIKAFQKLIKPAGLILVSEPNRKYAKTFFETLPRHNFSAKHFSYMIERENVKNTVNVYEVKRKNL